MEDREVVVNGEKIIVRTKLPENSKEDDILQYELEDTIDLKRIEKGVQDHDESR